MIENGAANRARRKHEHAFGGRGRVYAGFGELSNSGEEPHILWGPEHVHVFDTASGACLSR